MAQYNIEGDINDISERQLEYINDVIFELGFENSKAFIERVGKAGDNYASTVKRITVEGDNGSLKMIAKIAPTLEAMRLNMNTLLFFRNEHLMYTEVLPKLVQLQKDADIPEEEQLRYAKCYGSFTEPPNEVILLEDLQTSEFIMLDRFESLSNECVKSVLKNFAVLHSLSFVLRRKEPETFEKYRLNLVDMWSLMAEMEQLKMYFQWLEDDTISVLEDPEYTNFVRHKISNTLPMMTKLAKLQFNSNYTVIQQGDSWTNNIMFRFKGDRLTDSVMIDYQLSKATSPVCDIMYMIFNCTDHVTRSRNYYDWIDYYHSELDKSLANFNLKANFVYPRDRLDADLKQYGKLQFGLSVLLASVLIRKSDDAEKMVDTMKRTEETNMIEQAQGASILFLDEESRTRFKKRIVGLIDSFIEFGLLQRMS